MAEKVSVLVDTDILIKIYRGDVEKEKQLSSWNGPVYISSITAIELSMGVQNKRGMLALKRQLASYSIIEVSDQISKLARLLAIQYNTENSLFVADALIAATCLVHQFQLFTDNKKDFKFIKGLAFYKA